MSCVLETLIYFIGGVYCRRRCCCCRRGLMRRGCCVVLLVVGGYCCFGQVAAGLQGAEERLRAAPVGIAFGSL